MSILTDSLRSRIASMIGADRVVLFMKGTRAAPRCGFSAQVVSILDELVPEYTTHDILQDPELREGVKVYSDWPTFPQLYVQGELVGGCDIVKDLYASGALFDTLGVARPTPVQPKVTITAAAAEKLRAAIEAAPNQVLRLSVDSRLRPDLYVGEPTTSDAKVETNGLTLHLDAQSSRRADGLVIDFVDRGLDGAGFKIDQPNATPRP